MSPRPRSSDDAILRATLDVIAEEGVAGLTVETVAARAGIAKATIYRHWGSRAALIRAAMFSTLQEWSEPDTGVLRDDMAALLRQLVAYLGAPGSGRVFTSFVDAAAREPDLRALLRETERAGRSRFERILRRGVERGELPADLDVRLVIDLLMAPFVYRRVVLQSAIRPADIAPVVDAVLAACAAAPAST